LTPLAIFIRFWFYLVFFTPKDKQWQEKVRGMGLKPLVIIFFNPLAEGRDNGWNCLYRE